jgi:hypothetical protein
MEALVAAIGKTENIALIVLLLMCAGLSWAHIVWRKEEREDRAKMLDAFNSIVTALNELRVAIAAMTGKQV